MKIYIVLAHKEDETVVQQTLGMNGVAPDDIKFFVRERGYVDSKAHLGTLASVARTLNIKAYGKPVIVVSECDPYRRPKSWEDSFGEGMRHSIGESIQPIAYDRELSGQDLDRLVSFVKRKVVSA